MNHPDELLAEYVDGSLPTEGREVVEAHLASCDRCTLEVRLAGGARRALTSLPDEAAPEGLGARAIRDARRVRTVPSGAPRWSRWAGAAAAAAAIGLVIVTLPKLGGEQAERVAAPQASGSGAGGLASPEASARASGVEVVHTDYDVADLQALVMGYAGYSAAAPAELGAPAAQDGRSVQYSFSLLHDARDCLHTAFPPAKGELVRVIEARFEGTPAYIGVFLEIQGTDPRADVAVIVVAARSDCSILNTTTARI